MKFRLSQKPGMHTPSRAPSMSVAVPEGALTSAGDDARRHPDGDGHEERRKGQERGRLCALHQHVADGAIEEVGVPEVAPQHAPVEAQELLREGTVEAELAARGIDLGGRGVGA